jgi:hypothetical protein
MSYRVVIDLGHNEQVEELPELSLPDEFEIEYLEKRIKFEDLEDFEILFMGNIQNTEKGKNDKFTPEELVAIKKFVGEGGGLLITSGPGGDNDIPMKKGSIRVLYKVTGVKRYWNGVIHETGSNLLVKKNNILITDFFAHPITKGITEVVLPNCTFFTIEEDVEDLMLTSEKAEFKYFPEDIVDEIGPVPVCVASEFYNGRVVTVGSSDFLLEDEDFGLDAGDNLKFLKNILKWLTFET